MKLGYTILYVEDVDRSAAFYEKAFGLKRRFIHESGQYAEMKTGETTLAFASLELARSNLRDGFRKNDLAEPPAGIEVSFVTEDVETAFAAALEVGAKEAAGLATKPWGQTTAYVRDPDGVLVEISSHM